MKIFLLTLLFTMYLLPALAYKEDNRAGESQQTAGEQYSTLYKLSSKQTMAVKKLKKADEYVVRAKAQGDIVSAQDFESLLSSVQEDRKQQELRRVNNMVAQKVQNPRLLIVKPDHSVYANLYNMQTSQIKDWGKASGLHQQLKRRQK